jgi:dipeptidyl aminopeptidase/acylaminoacyl peptidase
LITHGERDEVVPISSARALSQQLTAWGLEVEFVTYLDEGHGYRSDAVRADVQQREVAFDLGR